eukprot:TRINITY_DN18106_c0_g1_i1.p1 TRINITY_DN18106_c0_g1~~TRINITY_DN18106_c0_g1_i1.p1  ORF type:complete len:666 (-),score=107.22 TRINITY_DN18106_c0_g1_i1:138-2135(-)
MGTVKAVEERIGCLESAFKDHFLQIEERLQPLESRTTSRLEVMVQTLRNDFDEFAKVRKDVDRLWTSLVELQDLVEHQRTKSPCTKESESKDPVENVEVEVSKDRGLKQEVTERTPSPSSSPSPTKEASTMRSPSTGVERQSRTPSPNKQSVKASGSLSARPARDSTRLPAKNSGSRSQLSLESPQPKISFLEEEQTLNSPTESFSRLSTIDFVLENSPEVLGDAITKIRAAVSNVVLNTNSALATFFTRLDRTSNGELSSEDWLRELRSSFKLSPDELSDDHAMAVFREVDVEDSGCITINEFLVLAWDPNDSSSMGADRYVKLASHLDVPLEVMLKVVSKLKKRSSIGGGPEFDEEFLRQIEKDGTGTITADTWVKVVRKELKLTAADATDPQLLKVFKKVGGDSAGLLDMHHLLDIIRAFPLEDKDYVIPKVIKPSPQLPAEVLGTLYHRIGHKCRTSTGFSTNEKWLRKVFKSRKSVLSLTDFSHFVRNDLKLSSREISTAQIGIIHGEFLRFFGAFGADAVKELSTPINSYQKPKDAKLVADLVRIRRALLLTTLIPKAMPKKPTHWATQIPVDTRVRVVNLIARADLNGSEGTVVGFDRQDWLYKVSMSDGSRMAFGHRFLRPIKDDDGSWSPLGVSSVATSTSSFLPRSMSASSSTKG